MSRGFTLLEVLVALVILTIGIIACVTLITGGQRNALSSQEKTIAWMVADSCFARLRATPLDESGAWQETEQSRLDAAAAESGKIKSILLTVDKVDSGENASFRVTLNFTMLSGRILSYTSALTDR